MAPSSGGQGHACKEFHISLAIIILEPLERSRAVGVGRLESNLTTSPTNLKKTCRFRLL